MRGQWHVCYSSELSIIVLLNYPYIMNSIFYVSLDYALCMLCSHDHIELLVKGSELLMFRQRDGPYIPTLRLLHKCER